MLLRKLLLNLAKESKEKYNYREKYTLFRKKKKTL